jgi:hypothetical protein
MSDMEAFDSIIEQTYLFKIIIPMAFYLEPNFTI